MNQILQLTQNGVPRRWISKETAALIYTRSKVCWELGDNRLLLRGGKNALGVQSFIEIAPVIATGSEKNGKYSRVPHLNNPVLFRRDGYLYLYCGNQFSSALLTRDHVIPRVQGGKDSWTNCVTACQRCNHHKGGRTPEQAGMQLLAIPFEPNIFEFMFLANRRILEDQMAYLSSRFSGKRTWAQAC